MTVLAKGIPNSSLSPNTCSNGLYRKHLRILSKRTPCWRAGAWDRPISPYNSATWAGFHRGACRLRRQRQLRSDGAPSESIHSPTRSLMSPFWRDSNAGPQWGAGHSNSGWGAWRADRISMIVSLVLFYWMKSSSRKNRHRLSLICASNYVN